MRDNTIYDFDTPLERHGTDSIKWDHSHFVFPSIPPDALSFWVADMDFPVAQPILDAMAERLAHPAFGYTVHQTEAYLEALTGWYERRFGWRFSHESVLFSPGVVKAISLAIRAFTAPGEGVLIQRPVYKPFSAMVERNQRVVVNTPLKRVGTRYEIDFVDFEEKVSRPDTKLFLLCSPHNPTGRVFSDEELRQMWELCVRHGVRVFSDEIHGDLLREGVSHLPLTKAVPAAKTGAIVAVAPSKTFNIPGLQMSNIIVEDPTLRAQYKRELDALFILGGTIFGGVATRAAYEAGESWLEQVLRYLDGNLRFMESALSRLMPRAALLSPEGTYLAWIDFRAYGLGAEELSRRMVQEARVLLSPGTMFGPEGAGYLRMNFATSRARLQEGLERMAGVL